MAGLEIQFKPLSQLPKGGLVEVSGAIDGNTIVEFQESLDKIQQSGVQRLVLDFSGVKYVNSTGLGALVKYADTFRKVGGGVALMKVPTKVKIVIEMLGLHAFFKICTNLDEALKELQNGGAKQDIEVKPSRSSAPRPVRTKDEPTAPLPPSARPRPSTPKPAAEPASAPAAAPPAEEVGEALLVECQACNLPLEIPTAGNFQCPRCFTIVSRTPDDKVTFQVPRQASPITMTLNCTPMCTEGFRYFLVAFGKKLGLPEATAQALEQVAREVGQAMLQYVYEGNPENFYHVFIDAKNSKLKIRISDYGRIIEPTKVDSLFRRSRQVMTSFRCDPHPRGGNIIHMDLKRQ